MSTPQPGIFALGTRDHFHLEFTVAAAHAVDDVRAALGRLREPAVTAGGFNLVVGLGPALLSRLAPELCPEGLHDFAAVEGIDGMRAPATQHDIWVWIHGTGVDIGFDAARAVSAAFAPVAELALEQQCFVYRDSRDLTGFIDGTANPPIEEAPQVALLPAGEPGGGGTCAITQRWVHDLTSFEALPVADQERVFARTKLDSIEFADVDKPVDAHIARVEIEVDGEELEIYRRSVPYGNLGEHGLYFVAFSAELSRFDLMLHNMFGVGGDGVRDRLTDFSTPVSGSYWFVPSIEALDQLAD